MLAGWLPLLACNLPAPARAQGSTLEYAVKAAFLFKLAAFVEWPNTLPANAFTICVVGFDPFGDLLDRAVAGQAIAGRPVAIRRLPTLSGLPLCQVAYASRQDRQLAMDVLAAVRGMPILTVTDGMRDRAARGIVNFVVVDERVRFEVDAAKAAENGLAVSSKLLSLAVDVQPRMAQ